MSLYTVYAAENLPKVYLVIPNDSVPRHCVPFNLFYLLGELRPTKQHIKTTYLPFAKGGQKRIESIIAEHGYCFYKWPGKILGESLGDVLETE